MIMYQGVERDVRGRRVKVCFDQVDLLFIHSEDQYH